MSETKDFSKFAKPWPKSPAMEMLAESMLQTTGTTMTRNEARRKRCCVHCKRSIDGTGIIRSMAEAKEWGLSYLCGPCWDKFMGGGG